MESDQAFRVPLFDVLRMNDRDFWDSVHVCCHDIYCTVCCWPYVLKAYKRRVLAPTLLYQPKYKGRSVHRAAWELFHGHAFPAGKQARRTCHNDQCANFNHVIPI